MTGQPGKPCAEKNPAAPGGVNAESFAKAAHA